MRLRSFLTLDSIVTLLYAVGLLIVPESMGATYGMQSSPSATLLARLFGVTMLIVGLIVWLSRDFTGANARPIITGSLIGDIVGVIVSLLATLAGTMNSFGWSAVVIYLVFGLGFAYYQFTGAPT